MSKIIYRGKKSSLQEAPEGETPQEAVVDESAVNTETVSAEPEIAVVDNQPVFEEPKIEKRAERKKSIRATVAKPAKPQPVEADEAPSPAADAEETAVTVADALEQGEQPDFVPHIADGEVGEAKEETFDKAKIVKYFKRHPKMAINTKVDRFTPDLNKGLNPEQVETRFKQFLFNDTNKKYSKSYASIFIGNICTFFNLLCLIAFIALLLAGMQGVTNYLVIVITAANIIIGIVQEIRSKLAIDKLSIMASSATKVLRDGDIIEVPTSELVLDDVIIMELGSQVPADCILAEGSVEVNESLLTGESVS
ncbi:MAG: hypothetical protein K2I17_01775, partial [Clostridia bacterium]|nr:hypothetical protein [Clostridia bacterium]